MAIVKTAISVTELLDMYIAVLTKNSLQFPDAMFDFFASLGAREVGFNLDEMDGCNTESSMSEKGASELYQHFIKVFWERLKENPNALSIREFKNIMTPPLTQVLPVFRRKPIPIKHSIAKAFRRDTEHPHLH